MQELGICCRFRCLHPILEILGSSSDSESHNTILLTCMLGCSSDVSNTLVSATHQEDLNWFQAPGFSSPSTSSCAHLGSEQLGKKSSFLIVFFLCACPLNRVYTDKQIQKMEHLLQPLNVPWIGLYLIAECLGLSPHCSPHSSFLL